MPKHATAMALLSQTEIANATALQLELVLRAASTRTALPATAKELQLQAMSTTLQPNDSKRTERVLAGAQLLELVLHAASIQTAQPATGTELPSLMELAPVGARRLEQVLLAASTQTALPAMATAKPT